MGGADSAAAVPLVQTKNPLQAKLGLPSIPQIQLINPMNLPQAILTEVIRFKSESPTGYTIVGFVAYYHDGINKTSLEVFGITRKEAIQNLQNPS